VNDERKIGRDHEDGGRKKDRLPLDPNLGNLLGPLPLPFPFVSLCLSPSTGESAHVPNSSIGGNIGKYESFVIAPARGIPPYGEAADPFEPDTGIVADDPGTGIGIGGGTDTSTRSLILRGLAFAFELDDVDVDGREG